MKPSLLILISLFVPVAVFAQKNVVPANQVTALNLKLPEGSKQDKRFLSTVAAASLLETEVNDPKVTLSEVEVYMLPPTPQSGFDGGVVAELGKSGFEIVPTDDDRIAWAVKGQTAYLIYFSMEKAETNLYLGKTNTVPVVNQASPVQQPPPIVIQPAIPSHIPPLPPARSSNPIRNN